MKVWITKYALTKGIFELSGEMCLGGKYFGPDRTTGYLTLFGPEEYAHSLEVAKAQAEEMRLNRIASLTRQLVKLKKVSFA